MESLLVFCKHMKTGNILLLMEIYFITKTKHLESNVSLPTPCLFRMEVLQSCLQGLQRVIHVCKGHTHWRLKPKNLNKIQLLKKTCKKNNLLNAIV